MPDSGSPIVNAAVASASSASADDQATSQPGYRKFPRRRATGEYSNSDPGTQIEVEEHELDSLA